MVDPGELAATKVDGSQKEQSAVRACFRTLLPSRCEGDILADGIR